MDQERSSKPKRKSNVYIKAGTMASLVKQRRSSFNQKSATACRPSNRESALSLIEEHPLPTPQDAGVAHVQTNSSTPPTEVVEEQVQSDSTTPVIEEQCEEQGPPVRTRKRGKTKMKSVHGRRDRKLILLNENDQPVGPTDADVMEFGSFLGTLARNAILCPLDILDWRFMDTKDDIWEYTKNKYDIPESGKKWALEAVDAAWRRHKYQLKRKHFRAYPTDELRMQNAPEDVPISQFKELLKYWKTDKLQKMSRIGSQNRKQLKNPHTCGKRSFAVVRHSMQSERDPSDSLSPKEIFVATRKRKPGRTYKCLDEDTTNKIAEMEEIEKQQNEDGNGSINAFASVMGPEHPGRVRLYGRGVTKTSLKEKVVSFEPSSNDRSYLKNLEDKIQRLEEKMEEQKTTIRQEVVVDFLEQLHRFGHDIDPKVILTALGLSREASSTCAAVQPINHPSTSSNNDSQLSPVPNTRVSAMVTRSQSYNANSENMNDKGVVDGMPPSRVKRETIFVKRPLHCNINPVDDPPTKIWEFYTPRNRHASRSVTTHTNVKIVSEIKLQLTGQLYERFKATCFGHFLNMPVFHVQNQLLVALLFREVVPPSYDALWFNINGKKLKFGLKEFALVTGLKCDGDILRDYSSKEPNRLIKTYFNGVERVSKTALRDCFNEQRWHNEDDAIKIAALYFINTFLFSTKNDENHPHLINKDHFDIVESGDWENYPWGIKVFEATIESMNDKVRVWASMYRFAGLPYALLVWFYECCSSVNNKLATRVGDSVPRILNWEVTKHLNFHNLQTGFFTLTGNKMILDNISPTELELSILQLPSDEEPEGDKLVHPNPDEYNDEFIRKEHFTVQLNLIKQGQLDLKKDIETIRQDIIGLKDLLVATTDRIFIELDIIAKKVASNANNKDCDMEANFSFGFGSDQEICAEEVTKNNEVHVQTVHIAKVSTPVEVGTEGGTNGDDDIFTPLSTQDYEILDEVCRSASKDSAKRNSDKNRSSNAKTPGNLVYAVGGHSGVNNHNLFPTQDLRRIFVDVASVETERNSTDILQCKAVYDKTPVHDGRGDIPSFNLFPSQDQIFFGSGSGTTGENNTSLVDEHSLKPTTGSFNGTDATLPDHQPVRFKRQPKFNKSPFTNPYGASGCCFPIVAKKVFFSRKHPFTTNIWRRVDSSLTSNFSSWIKNQLRKSRDDPYRRSANTLKPNYNFGVCLVGKKDWFHSLHYAERPLEESHLDVILYYLRKNGKYDDRVKARFTTTDCLFDSIIRDVYIRYKGDNNSLTMASDTRVLSDYMKGQSIRCNVSWHQVDNILFPIKVVADWHWVLGRLSFKERVLYVYDSKLDNYYYDDELIKAMEPYSIIIPLLLCDIGFYGSRNDLNHKTYLFGEKQMTEPFQVLHCYDMTGVRPNNYGVFAATFAEHFIHDRPMPSRSCNINRYRKRYGALLWEYGFNKLFYNADSEPED